MYPAVAEELERLVSPVTRGDPESLLFWTAKSTAKLAEEPHTRCGIQICAKSVGRLLKERGYSLQAPSRTLEGKRHPDREAQFEHIDAKTTEGIAQGVPVLSVDTKKKELISSFRNNGREWRPKAGPELVDIHDFPDQAIGKAIPFGVYDIGENRGYVNVGISHDTAAFAVASIEVWWKKHGSFRYRGARALIITADAGGSNGYRVRLWKYELQRFADAHHLTVHVCHFPPGTSKWNKIEHRLFSYISLNWRGRPLRTYETVVNTISNTATKAGLVVTAEMDKERYELGTKITDSQMRKLNIHRDEFHGKWNYSIHPRTGQ